MAYNDEYDEEENSEETQQDSLLKSKAKGMAKDAGKQVARQTKELAKKAAKEMWKLLLKIIGTKVFIIFSVIMFSIILLVAICAFLKINDGSKDDGNKGNVPYLVSETISNSTIIKNEDGSYSVGFVMGEGDNKKNVSFDEAVESILETLKENGDVLPQYLTVDEEKQKEFIKKFMQAEIATTYPKLGDSGLQGSIYIKRKGDDSNIANLQYISQEEFQKKVDGKNSDVKGYFTLDDQGNLQVAKEETIVTKEIENDKTISENTTTNITVSTADYKSALKKYTLTFDYLWALLVTTGDLDFMDSVSKLAIGSSVDVMLLDEKTVSVSTNVKEHDIIGRAKNKAYVDIIYADNETATRYFESEEYETGSSKYHYEQIITTTTITPNIQVTNAKTWLADYTNTYPENRNENSSGSNEVELKDTGEEKNYSDEQTSANNDNWYNDQVNSVAAGKKIKSINARWNNITSYNINENFKEGSSSSTVKYEYGNPVSETKERTDKNSQEENFVTLLVKSQRALDSLIEEKEWLFEMLKGNENAEYMIDVTKYLLYKATGKDYGVTELNLDEIKINDMIGAGLGQYIVKTDISGAMPSLTKEQLSQAITKCYSGDTKENLLGAIDSFIYIQNNNKVNAAFGVAVTIIESGGGTGWNAIDPSTHNWMSVTGSYNGQSYRNPNSSNPRVWCVYPSFDEATKDFGDLIQNSPYYFQNNRYTVSEIAVPYCDETWGVRICEELDKLYEAAGVRMNNSISGSGYWWPVGTTKDVSVDTDLPVNTTITSGVGPRWGASHNGIDIVANGQEYGTVNVISCANGKVIKTNDSCPHTDRSNGDECGGGYGNYVDIQLDSGIIVTYGHLALGSVKVKVGDKVTYGTVLGKIGSSGFSSAAHLHFEMRDNSNNVLDPEEYVSADSPRASNDVVSYALQFVGEGISRFANYETTDGKYFSPTEWCAMFVSYCFDNCGLIPSNLPESYVSCSVGVSNLSKNNKYKEASSGYVPVPGDIIFFTKGHTGIVTSCDGQKVYTVEGNVGDEDKNKSKVLKREYSLSDSGIQGYGLTGRK